MISRAGRYLARTTISTADGHVTAASSRRFEVTWPSIDVALPEGHVALASELTVRISARDIACGFSNVFSATGGMLLELLFLGLNPDYTDRLPSTPEPVIVYSTRPVAPAQPMTSLELTIPCPTVDQAGFYVAVLAYTGSHPEEHSVLVSVSNRMKVAWSPSYNLFPVFSDRATVFPCPVGGHVDMRYTQPLCHNTRDKVRLYRQVERVEGGLVSPVDLVYVAERRADAVGNVVRFPCAVLDPAAAGYCFKYVSTANSGSVRDQRTLCIPGETRCRERRRRFRV